MHAPYVCAQIWEWETCACSGSRCANAQRGHCTRRTRAGREGVHIPCRSHIIRDGHKVATLVQELAGLAGPHEHILHRDVKDQRPSLGANLNTYLRRARGGQVTTMDVVKPCAARLLRAVLPSATERQHARHSGCRENAGCHPVLTLLPDFCLQKSSRIESSRARAGAGARSAG